MSTEPSSKLTASRRNVLQASLATALTAAAGPSKAATPFFKLYMMIPNNQPARMVWGTLAAAQMSRIGIDVVTSFAPFTVIGPRRTRGDGKTHVDGGWDCYLERYLYSSIKPSPYALFGSSEMPPNGQNFYYVDDKEIDRSLRAVDSSLNEADRLKAYHDFEKRWYDIQPMTILFYPQDVVAVNPKLTGFDATTYTPTFYPQPEHWAIEGAGADATAAFASWQPPSSLIPMYSIGYSDSNVFGPAYNRLYEYRSWQDKTLIPSLASRHTMSDDGKHWVVTLRQGVKWHSGEEFTAADVKFTWDTMMNKAYGSQLQAICARVFGDQNAYKVTGKYEITIDLPAYSIDFLNSVMGAFAIMPEHAYKDIKPEALRSHAASTWLGSYTVKTSDGKSFTARGAVGTGPWIPKRGLLEAAYRQRQDVLCRQHQRHRCGAERAQGRRDRRARPDVRHRPRRQHDRSEVGQGTDLRFLQVAAHLLQPQASGVRPGHRDPARQERPVAGGRGRCLHSPGHQPRHAARPDRQGNRRRLWRRRHGADGLVGAGIRPRSAEADRLRPRSGPQVHGKGRLHLLKEPARCANLK